MSYEEVIALMAPHVGERVRVTWPNGAQRSGVVGLWRDEHLTLGAYQSGTRWIGGQLCGGEYDKAVRVEVMADNGRYKAV